MEKPSVNNLSGEEYSLWNRILELWECSINHDFETIDEAIHPNYTGWDNQSLVPHDRSEAIHSITDKSVDLLEYKLFPLGLSIYKHEVGIVNYRYQTKIMDPQKNVRAIKGRWTEVYLKENKQWILIGVHGGSESLKVVSAAEIY